MGEPQQILSMGTTRPGRNGWFLAFLGLLAVTLALAVAVVLLSRGAWASHDRAAELELLEKMNRARWVEQKMLSENLLRLRQMSQTLDKMGAE